MMLILLDIDGVMVSASPWKQPEILEDNFMDFSPQASKALEKIISSTKADILLTTSHKESFNLNEWKNIFKRRNININKIGKLPKNIGHLNRKDEILNWYGGNSINDCFIIIDDDKSLNALPVFLKSKLIQTSATVGLTDYLADEAIENLKHQQYEMA